eukprot:gene20559-31665_t
MILCRACSCWRSKKTERQNQKDQGNGAAGTIAVDAHGRPYGGFSRSDPSVTLERSSVGGESEMVEVNRGHSSLVGLSRLSEPARTPLEGPIDPSRKATGSWCATPTIADIDYFNNTANSLTMRGVSLGDTIVKCGDGTKDDLAVVIEDLGESLSPRYCVRQASTGANKWVSSVVLADAEMLIQSEADLLSYGTCDLMSDAEFLYKVRPADIKVSDAALVYCRRTLQGRWYDGTGGTWDVQDLSLRCTTVTGVQYIQKLTERAGMLLHHGLKVEK